MDERSYPDRGNVYKAGAILGIDQFLNDEFWPFNLICEKEGIIGKYEYSSFHQIKSQNAQAATRILNRLIRHKCYELLYDTKSKSKKLQNT